MRSTFIAFLFVANFIGLRAGNNVTYNIPCNKSDNCGVDGEVPDESSEKGKLSVKSRIATEDNFMSILDKVIQTTVSGFNFFDIFKISAGCLRSLMQVKDGIQNGQKWAMQFLDSSGKIPDSITNGGSLALGDFDSCINMNTTREFVGKSCIVRVTPRISGIREKSKNTLNEIFADVSITSTEKDQVVPSLKLAACVPSPCTEKDLQFLYKKVLKRWNFDCDVKTEICQIKKSFKFEHWEDYAVMITILFIVVLVVIGTLVDLIFLKKVNLQKEKLGTLWRILRCFSVVMNAQKLLNTNKSPDTIAIFNGIRVITMLWIILFHTYLFLPHEFLNNFNLLLTIEDDFLFHPILNGFAAVDIFFFMSGCLLMYNSMKTDVSLWIRIFRRFWRLTPPLSFVLASLLVFHKLGSGPVWPLAVERPLIRPCQDSWWSVILYFNNYYGKCMQYLWYVSADTQLHMIGLVIIAASSKRCIKFVLATLSGIAIIASIATTVVYRIPPLLTLSNIHRMGSIDYYFYHDYFLTHTHATVYFAGMAVGYIIHSKSKIRISPKIRILGWFLFVAPAVAFEYSGFVWHYTEVSPLVSGFYKVIGKIVWSVALAWVTISYCTGHEGFIDSFLSWSAFSVLAKLTYFTYLIHPIFIFMCYGSIRVPIQADHINLIYLYVAVVFISYMSAFFLSIFFEMPFTALDKMMFPKAPTRSSDANAHVGQEEIQEISSYKRNKENVVELSGKYIRRMSTDECVKEL